MRTPAFTRTVRFKLTVWYSSLLLVFGVAFVVALNLAVRLEQPPVVRLEGIRLDEVEWQPVRDGPGGAINGFTPVVSPSLILREAEDQIYEDSLDRLRFWSIIAVVGLAVASGFGGYILSGMLLDPVRRITQVASTIGATNLKQRIAYRGPDDELKTLADTFDSMIGRLETAFESQRQFVQDASHELRTPLAAIRTNIEVAEMDADVGAEEYRALLDTVKAQTERLTRLTEDLLLLTTREGDTPALEPVDMAALAREVVSQLGPVAERRGVILRLEGAGPAEATASGDLLYRCAFNLVDNAIKYSGAAGRVTVRTRREGSDVQIDVEDNGPGIPPEDAARIFDRFFRVDKGRGRREGGTGLGLAIVRELVEAMGGSVGVRSTPGEGSTFSIRMPAAEPPPAATLHPREAVSLAGS